MFLWIALCAPLIFAVAIVLALLASNIGKPKPVVATQAERRRTTAALRSRYSDLTGRVGRRRPTRQEARQMDKVRRLFVMFDDGFSYEGSLCLRHRSKDGLLWRVDGHRFFRTEPIAFLVVRCPSTGNDYVLFVPPEMKTVEQARAWTFHMEPPPKKKARVAAWAFLPARANPNEFNPNVET